MAYGVDEYPDDEEDDLGHIQDDDLDDDEIEEEEIQEEDL